MGKSTSARRLHSRGIMDSLSVPAERDDADTAEPSGQRHQWTELIRAPVRPDAG